MVHVLIALVVAVVGVPAITAANVVKTVQHMPAPLSFDRLTNADGLPNTNIRAIVQDQRGFIWFGTQEGLVRYDGTKLRVYRPVENTPTSISDGYITALALDANGKLWVGTAENGVNLYDPETDKFTRYGQGKGGLSSEGVTAIVRDTKDRMWFAMTGGGLNRFDPASSTFTDYRTAPLDATVTALDVDDAGTLWLGTEKEGVIRYNPGDGSTSTFRVVGDDSDNVSITSILGATNGKIWVGSDGSGLFELTPTTKAVVRHRHVETDPTSISDDHVTVLFEDRRRRLWIGTTNGLNRMDVTGGMIQYFQDPNDPTSIAFPVVASIYQDRGGEMWVGGFTVGVCKFDELRLKFGHFRTQNSALSYFEDSDGTLWVGTLNGGLYKYERAAQRMTRYQTLGTPGEVGSVGLGAAWISALHRDRRGTLWISVKGQGVIAFDTKNETYRQYLPDPDKANSLPVDTVFDIWEDDKGSLWLATWGGGLVRFDPKLETFTAITEGPSGLTSNYLYKLYPDPTDTKTLWIATAKGGLVKFDVVAGTGISFKHTTDPTSLSNDDVLSIYRDPGGTVWVGTYGGGLNKLDPVSKKAVHFTTTNSALTNDVVHGVLPDAEGKLWLSTNGGGLLQFDPKTSTFLVYQAYDGLQNNEFGQGSFMRGKSGELFFGGAGGFNAFFAKDIVRDPYVPPVVITGVTVFNQDLKLDQPIWTLPPLAMQYSDSFELQFAALSFAAPGKNRYSYKLEGFDDKFIETDRPFATYTKLDGGKYTLRVRAANQHGVWNETGVALKVAVAPPLWKTWPAYAIYVLLLAGAAYMVIRLQRQKVQRVEREGRLAAVERDLELTGAVQSGFLPAHSEINTEGVQLFGFYRAADTCSGDWWWHEALPGGRHVILVGDVTGHGPGPAMVTAAVATAFRVLIETGLTDVKRGLEMLNHEVVRVSKGKYHMCMAAFEIDEATGRWSLHNAGAPPIMSLNQDGKSRTHFCVGCPLGTETNFETGYVEGVLAPTDRILIYTDGIPEISMTNGNVLGMRRFAQMYERTRGQGLRTAAAAIAHQADQMRANQPQEDDWTFTMLEWNGGSVSNPSFGK